MPSSRDGEFAAMAQEQGSVPVLGSAMVGACASTGREKSYPFTSSTVAEIHRHQDDITGLKRSTDLLKNHMEVLEGKMRDWRVEYFNQKKEYKAISARLSAVEQVFNPSVLGEKESPLACGICLTNTVNVVLIPCGHVTCKECLSKVDKCPFCRKEFTVNDLYLQ